VYQAHQLAQIEKELNALRTCNHPNIVQFYDVLETESKVFLVMEHLAAGELYDHILQQGRLTEAEAGRLFGQVVSAIQHCHQRGIVHRSVGSSIQQANCNCSTAVRHRSPIVADADG
jgi:serine/threonine protein kinase